MWRLHATEWQAGKRFAKGVRERVTIAVVLCAAVLGCSSEPNSSPSSGETADTPDAASPDAGEPGHDGGDGGDGGNGGGAAAMTILFDGRDASAWKMAGLGSFSVEDGALVANPGDGLGLFWCTIPTPADFILELQWRRTAEDDNSGVFLRFPDPDSKGYDNTAWVGVHFGFEVQIDETGAPDGALVHTTGAIYEQEGQLLSQVPALPVGQWNQYEISVIGQSYRVVLNGVQVSEWVFGGDPAHPDRGQPSTRAVPRYIGLQSHTGRVEFRDIVLRAP
jgi:hypothetical protein